MVISTHLPPPVMNGQHGRPGRGDPHIVLQLRHVLFGSRFLRKIPRQHELGLEHGAGRLNSAIKGRSHPPVNVMENLPLHLRDDMAGVLLVPAPVQMLGHSAELDQEVAGQVLGFNLAALLLPEAEQGRLVLAHDDPGVRAADEPAPVPYRLACQRVQTILPTICFMSRVGLIENLLISFPLLVNRISIKGV
jgi:hypothetical protein